MVIEKVAAVRGATTVDNDTETDIRERTVELISEIIASDGIGKNGREAVSCLISTTADLTAFYPARAIRESGLLTCPLFSCLEPPIQNTLSKCIRVMIEITDTDLNGQAVRHVYLRGARSLRPDLSRSFCIAIDGPSGAGKSTIAKLLSAKLGMTYLDTGAMYRAIGLKMYNCGISVADVSFIEDTLEHTEISVSNYMGTQKVFLDGQDVSDEIRRHYVSKLASDFSAVKQVRLKLVDMQRKIAAQNDCILDGRDIGTYVLPDAAVKFYLTASVGTRARRRYDELVAKGEKCDLNSVEKDIEQRDYNDTHRDFAPLKKASDAVEVVSDNMNIDEVVNCMIRVIENKKQGIGQ